jgi:hypothetical protein
MKTADRDRQRRTSALAPERVAARQLIGHLPMQNMLEARELLGFQMTQQVENRLVAGNPDWHAAVVRNLTDEMSPPRIPTPDRPADKELVSSNSPEQSDPTSIIQRVSGLTIGELDRIIQQLQKVRSFLVSEEERMRREIAEYLKLSQSSISSTKAMSEMLANFGSAPNS